MWVKNSNNIPIVLLCTLKWLNTQNNKLFIYFFFQITNFEYIKYILSKIKQIEFLKFIFTHESRKIMDRTSVGTYYVHYYSYLFVLSSKTCICINLYIFLLWFFRSLVTDFSCLMFKI